MASGSGTITTSASWGSWKYSYSTAETESAIVFTVNIYLETQSWYTELLPGFCPAVIPDTALSSCPTSVYSSIDQQLMIDWVASKGGKSNYQKITDGNHAAGKYFDSTFALTLNKTPSQRTVNVYFGGLVQSTYMWNELFGETYVAVTVPSSYTAPSNLDVTLSGTPTTNSFDVKATWTNGTKVSTVSITGGVSSGTISSSGGIYKVTGLSPNTKYTITGTLSDGTTTLTDTVTIWTKPVVSLDLSRPSGREHSEIFANSSADIGSGNDVYSFKIDNTEWLTWSSTKSYTFTGLSGNSSHTIYTKMKNNTSGYESGIISKEITTWYDPIYSLVLNMTNRWFWYLSVDSTIDYQGGISNIKKFEFDIGGEGYKDKGTTNSHSRGSTAPTGTGKLNYNTDYVCKVRVTDNHGRSKETTATFKTLDERPLYMDGQLREVKVIKPDNTVVYITPNLLSIIDASGKLTNMNKIINNDSRVQFQ